MEWKPHYFDRTMSFLQKLVIKHRMVEFYGLEIRKIVQNR